MAEVDFRTVGRRGQFRSSGAAEAPVVSGTRPRSPGGMKRRRWRGTLSSAGLSTPLNGDMRLEIGLWLPDRRHRDVDNCCKSICDALNGSAYLDDFQVAELIVRRYVDRERPRAEVVIERVESDPGGCRGGS